MTAHNEVSDPNVEPTVYTPVSATANLRRSVIIGVVIGLVAIAITSVQSHPLLGVFGLLGIVLGAVNNVMLQKAVIRRATGGATNKRFTGSVAARLGGITLFAVAIALVVRPDGLGTFVGLAVFQVLMLVGAAVPVFRSLRPST